MAKTWMRVVLLFLSVFLSEIIAYTSGALPCEDHHPRCGHWASKGECKKNVKWMSKHCRISCGLCAQANVHDLYNQARMEKHGAFQLLIALIIVVVVGVFTKIYFEGPSCPSSAKLTGKTVVITGGNTGIGKETARIVAWRKARVIIGCRNITKGLQAAAEIIENTGNRNVEVKKLDLSSFKSVRKFAEEINEEEDRVDVLINNAGYFGPYLSTVDGLENTIQVNYLSHFLLSHLLLDKLKACSPSRIVNVSSQQHAKVSQIDINKVLSQKKEDYGVFKVYSNSKLCQLLSTIEMRSGVTVNALHPGVVRTEIIRNFRILQMWILRPVLLFVMYFFFKTPNGGSQTSVYCAVAEELKNVSGEYFKDCALKECSALAKDEALAKELWKQSEQLTGINKN
ncbi:retinol dehydrogenase 12-like isoform X2 [Orbicella faveolata]|uniref:retinol dehydrogenase 12-like isoform X2 n=1 Tax=Orbicella faveolata TaxID=48498 RepID=UPI0009E634DE|nr:retinol dehydrogenase 12-like isoform X2 [Orbicella faveolata]